MKSNRNVTRSISCPRGTLALLALLAVVTGTGTLMVADAAEGPEQSSAAYSADNGTGPIHILPVQGHVYMLVGDGANITAQVGDDGVLLVDAGLASMSDKLVATIEGTFHKPIRFIVETSMLPDHMGGVQSVAGRGRRYDVLSGNPTNLAANQGEGAEVIANQAIFNRLALPTSPDYTASAAKGNGAVSVDEAWPNDPYDGPRRLLEFNGEAVHVLHQPNANTDGDSIVWFTGSDVVSTGEIFSTTSYPVIDLARGGSIEGVVDGLNRLMYQITASGPHEQGGTLLIPGHGRLCDQGDLSFYQQMVIIIRDRIESMVEKGMSLQQVMAAKPTLDYDARYGATSGAWTTNMFIEAVYKSLQQAHSKRR